MIRDWEHHELRRSRRDLYHLSHEIVVREAHAAERDGHPSGSHRPSLDGHDFRAMALLADGLEAYAATSRTGANPPDAMAAPDHGANALVLALADAAADELARRRAEATGAAVAAIDNLSDKVDWAASVLRLRSGL